MKLQDLQEAKLARPEPKLNVTDKWKTSRHGALWYVRLQQFSNDNYYSLLVLARTEEEAVEIGRDYGWNQNGFGSDAESSFAERLEDYYDNYEMQEIYDTKEPPTPDNPVVLLDYGS